MSGWPSLGALSQNLAEGKTSAEGLARDALSRIAAQDHAVRAFITVDAEGAVTAARASDARRATGLPAGPLDGVPVAIKDNIDVAGMPTTDGTRFFAGRVAVADAAVVARLRAGGAVILGKLNMHEGALGATTDNPFWGRCDNPARPGHTPGGSSGGSAAAVAAGFVPWAVGTDTMGSVRIPAAYCGLWALKPTSGVIPNEGLMMLSPTLDTIGPIATGPKDLRLAFAAMSGVAMSAHPPDLEHVTLGLPSEVAEVALEGAVGDAFAAFVARIGRKLRIVPVSVAGWSPGRLRRAGLLLAEAEAAEILSADLVADAASGGVGFSAAFVALLAYGRAAQPDRLAQARARLRLAEAAVAAVFGGIDALLMPTAPQRAFAHGAPVPADQADLTALANAARVPAVAFPIPAVDGGFPASAQLIGSPGSEARLIALAEALVAP